MKRLTRYRCPECGISAEVAVKVKSVTCYRCRLPMRQVAGETEQPALLSTPHNDRPSR